MHLSGSVTIVNLNCGRKAFTCKVLGDKLGLLQTFDSRH